MVLEVLIDERKKNLEVHVDNYKTGPGWSLSSEDCSCRFVGTLAKNFISCSCGDRSVFPLAAMASVFKTQKHILSYEYKWVIKNSYHFGVYRRRT